MIALHGTVLHRKWAIALDAAIGALIEPITAVLIGVEVCILASGVFSRYVLHNALIWSDELAMILFIWLAMFGAVSAMRRGLHMRLLALRRAFGAGASQWVEAISAAVIALFCLEALVASKEVFILDLSDFTPALNLPRSWLIAPIIIAMGLILILAVLRLLDTDAKVIAGVISGTSVIVVAAYLARPLFPFLGNLNIVLFFVIVLGVLIAIGVPIAFAFGLATLSFLALTTTIPLPIVVNRMENGIGDVVLLAVPLFVLLGLLMANAGIAARLVDFITSIVGHFRGGLGAALVFAMYLVSGISGSKTADMAAVAPVLLPEMQRRGVEKSELIALLNASAAMSETIPPSLVLIIIGSVTGVSIAALFKAGLVPAAVAAALLLTVTLWRARKEQEDATSRPSLRRILRAFWVATPGLALPILIRAFVLGGIATATEVSTVGIIYTLLVGVLIYRELRWRAIYPQLIETAALTGAIMIIIATATLMSWALTQSGFAQQLAAASESLPGGAFTFLGASCILFAVFGSVLEGIPAIVLFGPLMFPIAAAYHIHEVQYAVVAILAMGIGLHAPPLGIGYYAACIIGKGSPDETISRTIPYLLAIAVALGLIAAIPWLSVGFLNTPSFSR